MKICCMADIHIGVKTYGKLDPETGLNTREINTLDNFNYIIDYCLDNEIKVLVIAGDMYKNSLPSPTLQNEVNKIIKKAADNNIYCLIGDGNHDVSKMDNNASPLKPFSTLQVDNVFHTRFHEEKDLTIDGETIKFVFLPTYHTEEEIEQICNNTKYEGNPIVYIGHMTIKNALLNDWNIADKETYIDADVFDKPGVSAVVLGHLHKYQIVNKKPLMFYTGSTQRIDFNEERQPKGFVVLDVSKDKVNHKFIEIESQKFCTLKFDFKEEENPKRKILEEMDLKKEKIKNAIVRIQLELDEVTKITVQDEKEIYQYANKLGAGNILTIQKKVSADKALRNSELTEHVSIEKGLELYYKDKPRAEQRIKLGKEIIKQIGLEVF